MSDVPTTLPFLIPMLFDDAAGGVSGSGGTETTTFGLEVVKSELVDQMEGEDDAAEGDEIDGEAEDGDMTLGGGVWNMVVEPALMLLEGVEGFGGVVTAGGENGV
jgi:hypothetical protein